MEIPAFLLTCDPGSKPILLSVVESVRYGRSRLVGGAEQVSLAGVYLNTV